MVMVFPESGDGDYDPEEELTDGDGNFATDYDEADGIKLISINYKDKISKSIFIQILTYCHKENVYKLTSHKQLKKKCNPFCNYLLCNYLSK